MNLIEKIKNYKNEIILSVFVFLITMSLTTIFFISEPSTASMIESDKPVLQIILSPDCGYCQNANVDIFKNLDILSDKYTLNLIYVGNINTKELKIVGVPTFILYKNGIEIKRTVGFLNTTTLIQELEK